MNRATNFAMTEAQLISRCRELGIGISVIEPLPSGGVRLVCTTMEGAETLREKCSKKIIAGTAKRTAFYETRQYRGDG